MFDLFFSLIFFAISKLPLAKFGFSKYPAGPFHRIVLLSSIILFIIFTVLGPISKINSSLEMLSIFFILGEEFKFFPTTTSSG